MNKHRKAMDQVKPQVPITPMLDLTFQLLFFFITLFNPDSAMRKLEGQMDLMLPTADKKDTGPASDPKDIDPSQQNDPDDLEVPAELTVIVNTQLDGSNNGTIASLFVEDRTGKKTPIDYDVRLTELIKYLKEERAEADNATIRVQGDSKVHWDGMIQVMDACRKAGFKNVGFMQPADYNLSGS